MNTGKVVKVVLKGLNINLGNINDSGCGEETSQPWWKLCRQRVPGQRAGPRWEWRGRGAGWRLSGGCNVEDFLTRLPLLPVSQGDLVLPNTSQCHSWSAPFTLLCSGDRVVYVGEGTMERSSEGKSEEPAAQAGDQRLPVLMPRMRAAKANQSSSPLCPAFCPQLPMKGHVRGEQGTVSLWPGAFLGSAWRMQ